MTCEVVHIEYKKMLLFVKAGFQPCRDKIWERMSERDILFAGSGHYVGHRSG